MGTSEICAVPRQTLGRAAHSATNTMPATTRIASEPRSRMFDVATGKEEREQHERQHPRQVEVEPVGQHELHGDEQRGGERSELERRPLPPGDEREDD